jgi:hypothetical protein
MGGHGRSGVLAVQIWTCESTITMKMLLRSLWQNASRVSGGQVR